MSNTLEYHLSMAKTFFGEKSAAVSYLKKKIEESPRGAKEVVIISESQLIALLADIHERSEKLKKEHPALSEGNDEEEV